MDSFFGYTRSELALELDGRCRSPTRVARCLFHAVYRRRIQSWDDLTRLPHRVRRWLANEVGIEHPSPVWRDSPREGIEVLRFRLSDEVTAQVELDGCPPAELSLARWWADRVAVLGRRGLLGRRVTARLTVEATGAGGHASDLEPGAPPPRRQLEAWEIVAQVVALLRLAPVTSLVLPGAAAPADGPDSRVRAREILCDKAGLGYAFRRVALVEELR